MLLELSVRDLGVIADLSIVVGPGMTAITGETGAGKTLVIEALELLVGGRADPLLVRPGADEAQVQGRFLAEDGEVVVTRVVPAEGRSRAYLDGSLETASQLAEFGRSLVDLHGQHSHQSLLTTPAQRAALDRFGDVDLSALDALRVRRAELDAHLAELGGDERSRAREIDLLRYQLQELDAAQLTTDDEDATLGAEETLLANAEAHRQAALSAYALLRDDGAALDRLADARARLDERGPYDALMDRLAGAIAEAEEVATELRQLAESIVDDPERLEAVRARRRLLGDLCRKYGETLEDVLGYSQDARRRLSALEDHDARAAALERERDETDAAIAAAEALVRAARAESAPALAAAIEDHLQELALAGARLEITVGQSGSGDDVTFLLSANPGEPPLPLAKVASGGELARAMLAARLVLTDAPDTLVFDEVDAGVGGEAALAVGRALATLAASRQVLVVTHLPQVAAFADQQIAVTKETRGERTVATATPVDGEQRVVELSRMLSGSPSSTTARGHAEELLAAASRQRARQSEHRSEANERSSISRAPMRSSVQPPKAAAP
jgi:DNA repair protein RecN (Recombination protein N)